MAGIYRVTSFFQQGSFGWSESWYLNAPSDSRLAASITRVMAMRMRLLNIQHTCGGVRISKEGDARYSRMILSGEDKEFNSAGVKISIPVKGSSDIRGGQVEGPPDQVRAALQLEVIKEHRRVSLKYLAGFPDDISGTEPGTINKPPVHPWWDMFDDWKAVIISEGWSIKMIDKSAENLSLPVLNFTVRQNAPGVLGVQLPLNIPWTTGVGERCTLSGVRMRSDGIRSPNGTWTVDMVETFQQAGMRIVYLRNALGFDPADIKTLGRVRSKKYVYAVPDLIAPYRIGIHKRGKPFDTPRGRVKVRTYVR